MQKFKELREATQYNPYAIGMAAAKKKAGYGAGPAHNLPKKVIVKAHEIAKKIKTNEDFDIDEILAEITTPMQKLRDALDRHSEHAIAANRAGDDEKVKVHQQYMNKIKDKMAKLARNEEVDFAELEDLCELSKGTLANYSQKAAHDVGNKMYAAGTHGAEAAAAREKNNPYTTAFHDKNRGKAHSKALTRLKGIKTAAKKLAKEEVEKLDEISKETLASYIPKAAQSARFSGMTAQDMQNRSDRARNKSTKDSYHRLSMKYKNRAWDREDNIKKAAQKLAKG